MKLYTFILTLCVCVLRARAASIPCEKNIDDLANVDLDDVVVQPELTDQTPVKDVDNNLRKTIVDIPVKVVEEPTVLDENSNDYVPKDDENIAIKRLEIDLSNPGTPQRQEHETQNPENHGELEKALFGIKKSVMDAQNSFNEGFKEVSNSFKSLFGANENLPDVHQKLDNLRHSFTNQIEKLHETIKSNLKSDKISEEKLKTAESYVEHLKKNFDAGIDILTEGVEVLTIIREEDEAVKTKSVSAKDGAADGATAGSSESTPSQTQTPPLSGVLAVLSNWYTSVSNTLSSFGQSAQNNFSSSSNPIAGLFQGINQGQKPTNPGQQDKPALPVGAQADPVPATSPTSTFPPWGPQAFLQQVQNTWQNLVNPGQNIQQDTPQPQQPAQQQTNNGLAQVFQNIGQFILRPGQAFTQQPQQQPQQQQPQQQQPQQQQPQQQQPQQQQSAQPTPGQGATSDSASAPSETPQNEVPQADASPAVPAKADAIPATPPQAQASAQPVQNRPIQQLVQNNPIIKGIQSAVQRLQGTPNPETPRNDIINEDNKENTKLKGINGSQGNGGDINSSGVEVVKEEQKEEVGIVKCNAEVLEEIKSEVAKLSSPSDKTE